MDPNGSVYKGGFIDGVRNGYGEYHYSNGASFKGEFVNGVRTGNGKYVMTEGDVYDGNWRDNFQSGHGTFTSKDGSLEFVGEFNQNHPVRGKLTAKDGEVREGSFEGGALYGGCKITQASGVWYEGKCEQNQPHGEGVLRKADGSVVFEGEWVKGAPQKGGGPERMRSGGGRGGGRRGRGRTGSRGEWG